jgi:hypothetical protein
VPAPALLFDAPVPLAPVSPEVNADPHAQAPVNSPHTASVEVSRMPFSVREAPRWRNSCASATLRK